MKILIFHASAGYGHKKVAEVLGQALAQKGAQVTVRDALDFTDGIFRKSYPAIYFYLVKYLPEVWGGCYELLDKKFLYACIRPVRSFLNRLWGAKLLAWVIQENPDVVVCTHFFSAELLASAKSKGLIRAKLITVVTDFFPHTFWIHPATDHYWVMNESSKDDLKRRGVEEQKVIAGGIPVDSIFKPTGKRKEILAKQGFSEDRLTLLFSSGSFGLAPYAEILRSLAEFDKKIQCFVVCGNNAEMKAKLEKETYTFPVKIFGFINFMSDLMEASDLLLAKSGGATTVESLAKGIPMIVLHPIPGQETRNARFLKEQNASFFMDDPSQIRPIIYSILRYPDLLKDKKKTVAAVARPAATDDFVKFIYAEN